MTIATYGKASAAVGWVGALAFMVVHLAGVALQLWTLTAAPFWIALGFLLMQNIGMILMRVGA